MLARGPAIARARQLACVLGVALVVAAVGSCGRARSTPGVNVLLISLDTVRQDALGCYGHRPKHAPAVPTTPTLDRLAGEGVRMVDAYAPSPWTLPSHLSMLTGEPPLVHGVETEVGTLDASIPTLAETLKHAGYRTAGIYSAPYLEPHWGFGRGFDDYRAEYAPAVVAASERAADIRARIERVVATADWQRYDDLKRQEVTIVQDLNRGSELASTSDQVTAAVVARLEDFAHGGTPWFLFAHFFDAHCDYVPPPPYDTRFDPDYTGSAHGTGCLSGDWVSRPDPDRPGAVIRIIGDRDLEHVIALYEGEVAWVDAHVDTILRALDARGLAQTTLVIVVSDHGEEFFEHGNLGHRHDLSEEETRVPMILRLPGVLPAGASVRGPVSLTDLVPTILDIVGLASTRPSGGTTFLPLVRGAEDGARRSVLLRLVTMFAGDVQVDAAQHVLFRQILVEDGFRRGPIKITRSRLWPQFPTDIAPELKALLDREAAAQYAREDLAWNDVERFAGEDPARAARVFAEPLARDALDDFRRQYGDLVTRRRRRTATVPQNVRLKLESLGYLETPSAPEFPEPDVVLPPPSPRS